MATVVKVPQLAWYGARELELTLPDSWQVEVCQMAGYDRPAMTDDQIKAAIAKPIGMPPIRELARGKKEVVIVFDDMTRVTRVARIVPFVLEELAEAGIPDSKIRFIAAIGAHGAMTRTDFAKKLGEAVLVRFPVYNHNPFFNCTYAGTTSYGTEVFINTEFMRCDFKIAIGMVAPHPFAVFGGGGKAVLPGVASIETIKANHRIPLHKETKHSHNTNARRLDIEEASKLAGLDMAIGCIVNGWGDTVAIFAGAEAAAYDAAGEYAKTHYITTKAQDKDIVIGNTFAKANEVTVALRAVASVSRKGGDLVLIGNAPEGQVQHYLLGSWGKTVLAGLEGKFTIPAHLNHLILFTEYPDIAGAGNIEESARLMLMNTWGDVIRALQEVHGNSAKVAVYPNADILYYA